MERRNKTTLSNAQIRAAKLKALKTKREREAIEKAQNKSTGSATAVAFTQAPIARAKNRPTSIVGTPSPIVFGPGYGKKPQKTESVSMSTGNRQYRALLVKNDRDKEWGAIKAEVLHDKSQEGRIDKELRAAWMRWQANGYFEPGAVFKIDTIVAPGSRRVY